MRTVTAGEQTILEGADYAIHVKVEVEDADGTYQDISAYFAGGDIAQDVDAIVPEARLRFHVSTEGGDSLSPLDQNSALNVDSLSAYAPLIDCGRGIRVEVATVAIGSTPSTYERLFTGTIDEWDTGPNPMEVIARSTIGRTIQDSWIEVETEYGSGGGTAMETVMGSILTDWASTVSLYTPTSPSFLITPYLQRLESVNDALRTLAGLIGWTVEERWDDGTSAFRLTLYEPDRSKTTADWTFSAADYTEVDRFALSSRDVRNDIDVYYTDSSGVRQSVNSSDATSQAAFGRQWMRIDEADDSPINTNTEAQDLADAALADLATPVAEKAIRTFLFWPVQLGDLIGLTANDYHYTADQKLAVTGFRHEFTEDGHGWTVLYLRGKPMGYRLGWFKRAGTNSTPDELVIAPTLEVTTETESSTTGTFGVTVNDPDGVAADLYYRTKSGTSAWGSWTLKTATPTDATEYTQTVTLIEDHPSHVQFRLSYTVNGSTLEVTETSQAFDRGKIPQFDVQIVWDDDWNVSCQLLGDFDFASAKIAEAHGAAPSVPSDATVRAASAVNVSTGRNILAANVDTAYAAFPVALDYGEKIIVAAFGYSASGGSGNESSTKVVKELVRPLPEPALTGVVLSSVTDDGTDDDYLVGWTANAGVSDATHDLSIYCYREGVLAVSTTEASPVTNSSKTVTDTGGGDSVSDDHYAEIYLRDSSGVLAVYRTLTIPSSL